MDRKGNILAFLDVIVKWGRKEKKSFINNIMSSNGKDYGEKLSR